MFPVLLFTERPQWENRGQFFLYTGALVFSPFAVWKFPLLWTQYGGAACLIPCLVSLLFVGFPLVCLEISLGQFMQRSGPRIWAVVPLFKGLWATSMAMVVVKVSTNLILAAWSVSFLYLVITNQLPSCVTDVTSSRLFPGENSAGNGSEPSAAVYRAVIPPTSRNGSAQASWDRGDLSHPLFGLAHDDNDQENVTCQHRFLQYWRLEMVEASSGLTSPGPAVLEIFITNVVVSIVCYLLVVRDIRWSGKIMYFLAPLPLAACVSIIVWTAYSGWSRWRDVPALMSPDFAKLAQPESWFGSVKMMLLSLGLGHHVIPFLGSYNNLDNPILKDSWLVCLLAVLAHVSVSLSVWGSLGRAFVVGGQHAGPWLLFAAVFAELRAFGSHVILSSVFCTLFIVVIISSTVVYTESLVSSFVDLSMKLKPWRLLIVTGTVSTCFLLTIPMSTQGGIFVFQLFDRVTDGGLIIVVVSLLECLAIGAVYGGNRFYDNLESMTGSRPHWWMKLCWTYLAPIILLTTLIYQEYHSPFFALGSEVEHFDLGNLVLLLMVVGILLQVVVVAICVVCRKSGSWVQKLRSSLRPDLKPHQVPMKWRLGGHWTKFGGRL